MDANPPTPAVDTATEAMIAGQVEAVRELDIEIANLTARRSEHKGTLLRMLVEYGQNWQDDAGYARIRAAGERPSYQAKQIDNHVLPLLLPLAGDARALADLAGRGWVSEVILDFSEEGEDNEQLAKLGIEPGGIIAEELDCADDGELRTAVRQLDIDDVARLLDRLADRLTDCATNLATARSVSKVPGGVTVK